MDDHIFCSYFQEPTSKLAESLFTAKDNIKDKKIQRTFILENNTTTKLRLFLKNSSNQQNVLSASNALLENNNPLEVSSNASARLQAPLKVLFSILCFSSLFSKMCSIFNYLYTSFTHLLLIIICW